MAIGSDRFNSPRTRQTRLMRLEERILLDASGIPDTDDTNNNTSPPPTDPLLAESDSVAEAPSLVDAPRVLLISSEADPTEALAAAALDDVVTVQYDGQNATAVDLLADIEDALDGREASSIAFAAHGASVGRLHLADDIVIDLDSLNDPGIAEFWQGIGALTTTDGRIDLLACEVAANDSGKALVDALETLSGRDVAASDDITGATVEGGDWILETDNIDAAILYFNTQSLSTFEGTLAGGPPPALGLLDANPTSLQSTLTQFADSGATAADTFGVSVDVSGNRMIIGDETGGADGKGRAYIYEWNGSTWGNPVATFDSGGVISDFGHDVAIDGDTAVVGVLNHAGAEAEVAFAYRYSSGTWSSSVLTNPDPDATPDDAFGESVAVNNGKVIIGAKYEHSGGNQRGAVYFFSHTGLFWQQQAVQGSQDQAYFGSDVDITFDGTDYRAVIGSPNYDGAGVDSGAINTIIYNGTNWTTSPSVQHAASDAAAGGLFGSAVALDVSRMVVGAPGQDGDGAAYVFDYGASWTQTAKLSASDGAAGDNFGQAVSVDDDLIVIGAPNADPGGIANAGSAYLFVNDGGWIESGRVQSATPAAGNQFGTGVTAWLDQGLIGDPANGTGTVSFVRTEPLVAENSVAGTVVGKIAADDPDGGAVYSLIDDAGGRFALSGSNVVVASGADLDFETATAYTIILQASDGTTVNESFTIHISDVFESTPSDPTVDPPPTADPPSVEPPPDAPSLPSDDSGSDDGASDDEAETPDEITEFELTGEVSFEQFLAESANPDIARFAAGLSLPVTSTEEEKDPLQPGKQEDDPWSLGDSNSSFLERMTDLAFREEVIFDPSQPEAIRAAFDSILHAYTTSSAELAAYLQSAFRSVAESSVMYRRSTDVLESATAEITALQQAEWPVATITTPLLKSLEAARAEVLLATSTLRDAVRGAAEAGETGFDRTFEDMVTGAVASLSRSNDQLFAASRSIEDVVRALRAYRLAKADPMSEDAIAALARVAQEQVASEVARLRQRWDLTSEDVFAAFIRRLVSERETAPAR